MTSSYRHPLPRTLRGLALSLLYACSSDAVVYRAAQPDAGPTSSLEHRARASIETATAGAGDGRSCGSGGAAAIVARFLDAPGDSGTWLQFNASCETDADCSKTLFAPVCDQASAICTGCPDAAQQTSLDARVTTCLVASVERCCLDGSSSPVDCLFRDCGASCGAQ